jgi:4-amino-4-deoxy-L-arabinose transferase-like glycosyltransferase
MVALKWLLLAADAIPFNSDEAMVGLAARHILQGERPVFFYGQAYLGSLDSWLIAFAFAIFGDTVESIRLVQIVLYAGTMITAYLMARRVLDDEWAARATALLYAIPIPLVTTYTTATLGGYGETLLIGNVLLLLIYRLDHMPSSRWTWVAFGLIAGLGFWTSVMTMVYAVPAALWLLWRVRRAVWPGLLSAALAFLVGSAPWWVALVEMQGAPLREMLGIGERGVALAGSFLNDVALHAFYWVTFGSTVLFSLRFPWSSELIAPLLAPIALAINALAIGYAIRNLKSNRRMLPLWGLALCLTAGFIFTSFGNDPSGRYFLPLYLPLSICVAALSSYLRRRKVWLGGLMLAALLGYNLLTTVAAATRVPPGVTTQFDAVTSIDWRQDDELIEFLDAHGVTRGYSNYWVAYRLAFRSDERIIFAPRLPYHTDFRYTTHDDRYPVYTTMVDAAPRAAYITTHFPELDGRLRAAFDERDITFAEMQIADYHIFYDLSKKVTPDELDLRLVTQQ